MDTFSLSTIIRINPIQNLFLALLKWGPNSYNTKIHTLRNKNVENFIWRRVGMEKEMGRNRERRTREVAIWKLLKIFKYQNRLVLLN